MRCDDACGKCLFGCVVPVYITAVLMEMYKKLTEYTKKRNLKLSRT
jgi:hypothetical protein